MEAIDQSLIPVALFMMLQNVVLTFESTNEVCTVEKTFLFFEDKVLKQLYLYFLLLALILQRLAIQTCEEGLQLRKFANAQTLRLYRHVNVLDGHMFYTSASVRHLLRLSSHSSQILHCGVKLSRYMPLNLISMSLITPCKFSHQEKKKVIIDSTKRTTNLTFRYTSYKLICYLKFHTVKLSKSHICLILVLFNEQSRGYQYNLIYVISI